MESVMKLLLLSQDPLKVAAAFAIAKEMLWVKHQISFIKSQLSAADIITDVNSCLYQVLSSIPISMLNSKPQTQSSSLSLSGYWPMVKTIDQQQSPTPASEKTCKWSL